MARLVALLVLLAALAGPVLAQESARLAGQVVDQTGGVLPGVTVDLDSGGETISVSTDATGRFAFTRVSAGVAHVTFRLVNFSISRHTVVVPAGGTVRVDAVLTLALDADVVVTGSATFRNIADVANPGESLVGIASSASQGAVTLAQMRARPIMRAGEVLETVPGLVVSQHSGEGKANQYYLRGFNLDHGTDFSTTVAGVPVNLPTGAHAHGYADASFLIPELVSGVQFKKGPYFADEGDFSAAGAANINYVNRLERPTVRLGGGQNGWGRLFAAASPTVGAGTMLAALELGHSDGPWERPDDYRKVNTVLRYSRGDARNGYSMTGMGYWADWNATDQVPTRAVSAGALGRFGAVDTTDGGQAERQSAAFEFQRSRGPAAWRGTAFVLRNSLDLFSNFTYFLDDPASGDQFHQAERRVTVGGRLTRRQLGRMFGRRSETGLGVQVRHDRLAPVGLYRTQARQRLSTTREDQVGQTMAAVHGQVEIEWLPRLRTTVGGRADLYHFDVTSDLPDNSGAGAAGLFSPKVGAAFGLGDSTELYVNAGSGFHSNDARGATIRLDPVAGESVSSVTPLVRATGAEVGLRTVRVRGLQSTVALWYLDVASELLFVGDAGTSTAGRPSRRVGVEWTNYARVAPWLTLDADVAITRARFRDDDPAGAAVPGALDRVLSAGVTVARDPDWSGSLRLRHFGPRPLLEDASVRSRGTTMWSGEVGYRVLSKARLVLEGFNLLDARVSDIDYFYRSRLPGEDDAGVDDIHTHPALPRTVRLELQIGF